MTKNRASKKMVGIKCQCQDRAVPIKKKKMKTVQCPSCGKIYTTNRESTICFNCMKSRI
ncbi:MAG: hypothetical protein Q8M06_08695 [Methanobacteriaceae archaeon]|nr:hypothetical protein [Methanobacteriaceae archaeon]